MLVSVYIRKDDEKLWRELPNKAEAISSMLRGQKVSAVKVVETHPPSTPKQKVPSPRITPEEVINIFNGSITTADKIKSNGVCKTHGTPLTNDGRCLQKGH